MLNQKKVFEVLEKNGVSFFAGVPDSYLNGFCNYVTENFPQNNIIAANEGNAIAIATGYYIATKNIPLVYLQNSGMGNAVNPLVSLVDEQVYSVPMLLLIGWRGQPGTRDWPQHVKQGRITLNLLELLNIPYSILEDGDDSFPALVQKAVTYCATRRQPYALISPKGVMTEEKIDVSNDVYPLSRREAIEVILDSMPTDTIYVATTGRTTRELFFLREKRGESKQCDFLNVGSMGHASSVAQGIALARPERKVVVLDGDSAALMHLGALSMINKLSIANYLHVILNNGVHESVGGQPSAGYETNFTIIADACGFKTVGKSITTKNELIMSLSELRNCGNAALIDCRIHKGLTERLPALNFSLNDAIDSLIENLNTND